MYQNMYLVKQFPSLLFIEWEFVMSASGFLPQEKYFLIVVGFTWFFDFWKVVHFSWFLKF